MNLVLLIEDSQTSQLSEVAALLGARDGSFSQRAIRRGPLRPHSPRVATPGCSDTEEFVRSSISQSPVWLIPQANLGSDVVYGLIPLDEEYPNAFGPPGRCESRRRSKNSNSSLNRPSSGRHSTCRWSVCSQLARGLSIHDIEMAWLHDADLLRHLCGGEYRQVTAIHSGISDQGVSTASVSLAGEDVPDAMWALRTAPQLAAS